MANLNKKEKHRALHSWIWRHKPSSGVCEICNRKAPLDAANISGKYLRDINDFRWLCRRCHIHGDGRLKSNLIQYKNNLVIDDEYTPMNMPAWKKYNLRHAEERKASYRKYYYENIEKCRAAKRARDLRKRLG